MPGLRLPGRPEAVGPVAQALDAGQVVVLPTDTVYGLAARLDRPGALATVFALKGRPPGLALPVLVGSPRQVHQVAAAWPAAAASLADRFWPGPLTLVVPALPEVGAAVGGGGGTVGVRHPRHDFVGALCRETGPLAVTSANRHGEPPCTTAQAAAELFDGDLLVVDGGTCDAPPSTVVDCTQSPPSCVRQGAVPWARVEEALR